MHFNTHHCARILFVLAAAWAKPKYTHTHTRAHSSRVLREMPSTPSLFVDCLVCKCAHLFDCEAQALLHFLARFFQLKFILSSISPSSSFAPSKWRAVCFSIERNSLHTIFVGFNRRCRRTMHACSTSHSIASRFRAVRVYVAVKTNPKVQDRARYMHRSWYTQHTHTHTTTNKSQPSTERPTMSRSFYPYSRILWRKHTARWHGMSALVFTFEHLACVRVSVSEFVLSEILRRSCMRLNRWCPLPFV